VSSSAIPPGVFVVGQKQLFSGKQFVLESQKPSHPELSQVSKHFFPEQKTSAF
jgi:hypothetical protein